MDDKLDIVVIDNDKTDCIRDTLKEFANLTVFDDAQRGLEYMEQHAPDILVMDINMPVIDGQHMCNILRRSKNLKNLPIVLISGDSSIGDFSLYFKGVDFVQKPIDPDKLMGKVRLYHKLRVLQDTLEDML